jgi:hypothetical protein
MTAIVFCKYSPFGNNAEDRSKIDRFDKSDEMEEAIPGNWILTATGRPVEAIVALWTWPMDADAIGTLSKEENIFCQSGPNSVDMTFYLVSIDRQKMTYLHLPIGHVVGMSLDLL